MGTVEVDEPSLNEDATDLAQHIANLSPTTQQNLGILLKSISKGEARIDTDKDGLAQIQYTQSQSRKLYWDGSNANVIAQPKSNQDIQVKVDACLELIGYLKAEKQPSGVLLDPTMISLSQKKEYRPDFEFEKTKKVLGSGNSAGDIVVVKDKQTGLEHGQKTIMISCFRKEEVLCWVDMSDTGYVPALYLFKIENQRVTLHMEILNNAKTLRSIIDEHMRVIKQTESLVKPFSLLVLDGALEAVTALHRKGWVHQDPHAMKIVHPSDVQECRDLVKDKLNKAMLDANTEKQICRQIVALLFPEDFKPVHTANNTRLERSGGPVASSDDIRGPVASGDDIRGPDASGDSASASELEEASTKVSDEYLEELRCAFCVTCGSR